MKICIVGDVHFSTYSSILRRRGNNFSVRLEYLIRSLNWIEQIAKEYNCEEEVFLGDFFDKPDLTAEEISALSEIDWVNNPRTRHFLVGNHDSGVASLKYNSTQALHNKGVIEDTVHYYQLDDKTEFLFLPYVTEDNRIPLKELCLERNKNKKLIVFSHNDIKDFQMGAFLSKTGYAIKDIENNCDLYINGHLHNGGWVTKKILNLGNITGQNFSEDAFRYEHHIAILDTDTLDIEFIENPYALNFYKITIENENDINTLATLKNNAVITIRCLDKLMSKVKEKLSDLPNIIEYRIVAYSLNKINPELVQETSINNIDHLAYFRKFCIDKLTTTPLLEEELSEVCK